MAGSELAGTSRGRPGAWCSGELLGWLLCSSAHVPCEKKAGLRSTELELFWGFRALCNPRDSKLRKRFCGKDQKCKQHV